MVSPLVLVSVRLGPIAVLTARALAPASRLVVLIVVIVLVAILRTARGTELEVGLLGVVLVADLDLHGLSHVRDQIRDPLIERRSCLHEAGHLRHAPRFRLERDDLQLAAPELELLAR